MAVGGTTWGSPWDRVCVRPSRKGSIAFGPDTFASHKQTLRNRPSRGYEPRRGPTNGTGGSHPVHDLASARTGRRGRLLPAGSPALDPRERWRPGWATTMRCGRNSTIRQLRRTNSHSSRPRRTAARCDRSGGRKRSRARRRRTSGLATVATRSAVERRSRGLAVPPHPSSTARSPRCRQHLRRREPNAW